MIMTQTSTLMWGRWIFLPLLALNPYVSGAAFALDDTSMKDPTVPPAAWLAAQPAVPGAPAADAVADAAGASNVQVIVVGKSRRFALVDGQVVKPGDLLNDSKVLSIQGDRVVLEDQTKSLGMTPQVEKRTPVSARVTARKKVIVIPAENESSKVLTGSNP
jgi:hypothetical protein